ncbi:hypothetical protein GQ55_2G073100 [Panicum hallii var. hallii]|uniref:soluble epoxide hydrolase n=1 Tax=Panicum hallii var. hallii TaxID=1504633 RepID=A0A2T7EMF0_9POAL|nr:hypothetical protein GQ55_2G073100 [Panicum hallii var. hallii]
MSTTATELEGVAVTHRTLEVNGIRIHVAEAGDGSAGGTVLFLLGFLELWHSWRNQLRSLAARGYRCVAPDLRGYGGSSAPPSPSAYTVFHLAGDVVGVLDALAVPRAFVVCQGWGALLAWHLATFRPDRVRALVAVGVAFMPRDPAARPLEAFRRLYGDGYYMLRMQEPGAMEAEFARMGARFVFRKVLTTRDTGAVSLSPEWWGPPDQDIPLPPWLSEEYVDSLAPTFDETGFAGAMNFYRCLDLNWELTAPWTGAKVTVPTKYMAGEEAMSYNYTGVQEYIHKGGLKGDVPGLEEVAVIAGAASFIHLEKAEEVTQHIYDFIKKF